ncbi:MAG TPA: DHA2 family efflux MFS transporter permease subunit [Stellaceae bacterium]|nr:DHA2 family efflux MFS transporter permease subunit [Stellaceae bacterium]
MTEPAAWRAPLLGNRFLVAVATMLATVMQVIDQTIANVALPRMQGGLAATQDQITWVLTSYIIAAAIAMPLTGWLSGRFGRKRIFLLSVVGFTVASVCCGAAQSLAQMVAFRLLQGVCGAALVPLSQAILLDVFPREQRGPAMAFWGVGIMAGPILGPTLGGWLTDNWDWRWVFYINLPVGALAWLGIVLSIEETALDRDRPFDFFGFAMLSLGMGGLQMMLDRGELKDWFSSREIQVEAALAALGFYSFIVHSLTARHPFLHPQLFRDRNLVAGLIVSFVVGIMLLASAALLPPLLQGLMNFPVMTTGMVMAPRGIGTAIVMVIAGRLVQRTDARWIIFVGFLLTAYSLWDMAQRFSLQMDSWSVIWTGFVQGLGLGLVFPPLSTIAFATLPPALRTEAAGIFTLARSLGSSIGVSVVMATLTANIQVVHASVAAHVTPYLHRLALPPLWNPHSAAGIAALNLEVTRQAAMVAFIDDFLLMMVVTLAAAPLIALMRNPRRVAVPAGANVVE